MAYTTIDDPTIYFNTVLYTGNATARTITGVGFQPDWVWGKIRSESQDHVLVDSVRGATKQIYSSDTSAEQTESQGLTGFASDGFTLGTHAYFNKNTATYVAWNWLAGNSTSSNGDGSITSTVSANTTAGFSIVTYTGNNTAGATVGHGLGGVAPSMVILKNRNRTDNRDWVIYHTGLTSASYYIYLNSNAGQAGTYANFWNNTAPNSSVITLGSGDTATNGSGDTYVAYCFAEKKGYSKFGSYTGNGNADGTFVYTGFKPAWVMIKRTDTANDWNIQDSKRTDYNGKQTTSLQANTSSSESTIGTDFRRDILSNGFKIRNDGAETNASGGTYIYMAFAESPFVNSNSIPNNAR
jgi:hypothetical protein